MMECIGRKKFTTLKKSIRRVSVKMSHEGNGVFWRAVGCVKNTVSDWGYAACRPCSEFVIGRSSRQILPLYL
jgi:hypothetical protein